MKLIVDTNPNAEALRCLIVAFAYDIPFELVRSSGCERPRLMNESFSVPIVSSYAICSYIINSKKNKDILNIEQKFYWDQEDCISWALCDLKHALSGVNKKAIQVALDTLEKKLEKNSSGFLISNSFSLSDIFVWTTLRTSKIHYVLGEISATIPKLRFYVSHIENQANVQQAIKLLYGGQPLSLCRQPCTSDTPQETFYITTAINYTNGSPHIGHAYEAVIADVIARFQRIYGRDVFFLTGTDEHGQKIATTAERQGMKPIELCDFYAAQFKSLNKQLNMSYDFFIRTSSAQHKKIAQNIWTIAFNSGDIYLDKYTGWYNVREETFVTDREAEASDYKDPTSGVALQKMEEVSYFFRLSKYQEQLIKYINDNPEFIQPDFRRNEIISRLKEPLEDLSISRTTFSWGIPVPNDPAHVMYVWLDALTCYISGIQYGLDSPLNRFWPANVHIIGKDIIWFHCVIWPCLLMSAALPMPKTVFAHGFVVAGDGHKMSKSLGNVVDPVMLLSQMPNADSFRYFIIKAAEIGRDMRFDITALNDAHNNDLADTIGNMVHRATGLCAKFCNGRVPDCPLPDGEPPFDFDKLLLRVNHLMKTFSLQEALENIMAACRDTNKYLTDKAPWAISEDLEKQKVTRIIIEAVYYLAHFLEPFIPITADKIFKRLGTPKTKARCLSGWYDNLIPGTEVTVDDVLFVKGEISNLKPVN